MPDKNAADLTLGGDVAKTEDTEQDAVLGTNSVGGNDDWAERDRRGSALRAAIESFGPGAGNTGAILDRATAFNEFLRGPIPTQPEAPVTDEAE